MALYPYVATLAVDPVTFVAAKGATGTIHAPEDIAFASPLTATDANGNPIPLTANADGILPSFYAERPAVNWRSGPYTFPLVTSQPLEGPKGDKGDNGANGANGSNVLPTDTAIKNAVSTPTSATASFLRTEYGVSIVNYGAKGDGTTNDTAAIQAALDSGARRVLVPAPSVAYRITARLRPKAGQTIIGEGWRSVIRQDTWGETVFDAVDVDDLTVENLRCLTTQARTFNPTSGRGDNKGAENAGIWSNGNRLNIRNVWVDGFIVGAYLTNWHMDATGAWVWTVQEGTRINGLTVNSVDFGVLVRGQKDCRLENITGSYTVVPGDPGALPPPHLIYFAANQRSYDVVVANCSATNGSTYEDAYAFQFKSVTRGTVTGLMADNCRGLMALFDCEDMNFSQLTSTNDQGISGQGSITLANVGNKRVSIDGANIDMAVDARAMRIDGEDGRFRNIQTFTKRETSNPSLPDISVYGNRNTLDNVTDTNKGAGGATGILVHAGTRHRVIRPKLFNVFRGVYVDNAATGTVVDYDPADMTPSTASGGNYRSVVAGTGGTLLTRPNRVATFTANGGDVKPEPSSHGVLIHTTTGTSNMLVYNPRSEGRALGLQLTVTIANGSTGTAGAITWQPDYAFRGAAPVSPAAGARISVTFMWDGTAWQETSRTA
jgi:hypothetical protein